MNQNTSGDFVLIAGISHAGGAEIAALANAPERGVLCHAHLRGRLLGQVTRWLNPDLPADPWALSRLELEQADRLGDIHQAYFEAVAHDRSLFDVVGDANSWQMPLLPAVHKAMPLTRVLIPLVNGIVWVEAVRQARAALPDDHYVFTRRLADCAQAMGLRPPPPHGRFASLCAEWTLVLELPNFLLTRVFAMAGVDPGKLVQLRHPHVRLMRCEDFAGSGGAAFLADTCRWLAGRPIGGAEKDAAAWLRLRSLAAADPVAIWASWTTAERAMFTEVGGKAMGLLGYPLPPAQVAA